MNKIKMKYSELEKMIKSIILSDYDCYIIENMFYVMCDDSKIYFACRIK